MVDRTPDHRYTISSPCEPDGSSELKKKGGSKQLSFEAQINSHGLSNCEH